MRCRLASFDEAVRKLFDLRALLSNTSTKTVIGSSFPLKLKLFELSLLVGVVGFRFKLSKRKSNYQ